LLNKKNVAYKDFIYKSRTYHRLSLLLHTLMGPLREHTPDPSDVINHGLSQSVLIIYLFDIYINHTREKTPNK